MLTAAESGRGGPGCRPGTRCAILTLALWWGGGIQDLSAEPVAGGRDGALTELSAPVTGADTVRTGGVLPGKIDRASRRAHVQGADSLQARLALTPADFVRHVQGVNHASQGMLSAGLVTRGFNDPFAGTMQVFVDHRPVRLPSLQAHVFSLVPVVNEDIERIELLLGSGSAAHGANATGGALHLTTRSSLEGPVTRMSVLGGERGLRSGSISSSRRLAEDVGLRVSATYLQGDEWE